MGLRVILIRFISSALFRTPLLLESAEITMLLRVLKEPEKVTDKG